MGWTRRDVEHGGREGYPWLDEGGTGEVMDDGNVV